MAWQDVILTVGNLIFAVSLIPSIRSKDKPHVLTSFMTGAVLVVFSITYMTLNLYFAMAVLLGTASMWFFLAWQKYKQK